MSESHRGEFFPDADLATEHQPYRLSWVPGVSSTVFVVAKSEMGRFRRWLVNDALFPIELVPREESTFAWKQAKADSSFRSE